MPFSRPYSSRDFQRAERPREPRGQKRAFAALSLRQNSSFVLNNYYELLVGEIIGPVQQNIPPGTIRIWTNFPLI